MTTITQPAVRRRFAHGVSMRSPWWLLLLTGGVLGALTFAFLTAANYAAHH